METLPDRDQAPAPQGQMQAEGKGGRRSQGLPGLVVMLRVCLPTEEGLQENTKKLRIVRNIRNSTITLCAQEGEYTGGVYSFYS